MLKIAICDDSRTDVEMLESAFDKLRHYVIDVVENRKYRHFYWSRHSF